jgi:dienelactone hydrolase
MDDFNRVKVNFYGKQRTVLVSRLGDRPVMLLHEIYGVSTKLVNFARIIAGAGFKVYMPVLYGAPIPEGGGTIDRAKRIFEFLCVAREFHVLASDEPGPWTPWLRKLLAQACTECHAKGAGVIGLCLTGNFALSMACDPQVLAPVLGEPSLPFWPADGLHVAPEELMEIKRRINDEGLQVRAYRYATDTICKAVRSAKLETELGNGFQGTTIPASQKVHSVFTEDLCDESGRPRHNKIQEVIAFLKEKL